ncbi:hypothetical protein FB45DRAFT_795291 [Roridomyces roridus]|uniref:MYND-type domain-containing protein n=1 Tax=Roridomyces roridus TaxID=1738132 RepID=A0AAD7BPT2_9AGAR|nr:hypothetical protein FB45DRAFT_795291 [Roridomyces roridus]
MPPRPTEPGAVLDPKFKELIEAFSNMNNQVAPLELSLMRPGIADAILDPDLMTNLQAFMSSNQQVMPDVKKSMFKKGEKGTLDERIAERCEFARMGVKLASLSGSPLMVKGPVPLRDPPVKDGMMYSVRAIERIVRKGYKPGKKCAEFSQLAYLFRRVRHLLRVFYNYYVGKRPHPDLIFCDWEKVADVGLTLHEIGICLQLDPPRLRAIMAGGGSDLEVFLLEEPFDVGIFRRAANFVDEALSADAEADDDQRWAAGKVENHADDDIAAHLFSWFIGDITVAFFLNENAHSGEDERRWAEKAIKRLVFWSTSVAYRKALGDPLTDAMRPIYWNTPALVKFSQAGGLGALFGDWTNSLCKDWCEEVLTKLPDAAWENQTPTSLQHVTRELQELLAHKGNILTTNPILVDAFFNMYRRYGLAPFRAASKAEAHNDPVIFYYIQHRIKGEDLPMRSREDWRKLLAEYVAMPRAARKRYSWANLSVSMQWACLDDRDYGCSFEGCKEREALEALREKRVRGMREAKIEERLEKWGSKPKACSACGWTAYCCGQCQKADWGRHKPECLKKRKKA